MGHEVSQLAEPTERYRYTHRSPCHSSSLTHRQNGGETLQGCAPVRQERHDFVFKIGGSASEPPIMLTAEQALGLFEAAPSEEPVKVDKGFDKVYQYVKMRLFQSGKPDEDEKAQLKARDKIDLWTDNEVLPKDYLKDLLTVLDNGELTGEEIRFINKQSFEARQKRILVDQDYFKADLIFYHRILKCHVIVDLKIDRFRHEYASQLNLPNEQ